MFAVFMYHALTYCYMNNEHGRNIFYFTVFQSHYFTEFHGSFWLEDCSTLSVSTPLTLSVHIHLSVSSHTLNPSRGGWLPWKEL